MAERPHVLWPAPGWPALLGAAEDTVELLVAHADRGLAPLAAWADGLAARAGCEGPTARLGRRAIEAVPAPLEEPRIAAAAAALRPPAVARIRLAAPLPAPAPPARVRMFDLVDAERVVRPRALGRHAFTGSLRVAFASDLHHAARWDVVRAAVERHAPDLVPRLVDPNRQVRRLVAAVNARARRGALDALVLGGDLVDHVYREGRTRRSGCAADSNLPGLVAALAALEVPCFALTGNHDRRLYPWRPRTHGLAAIGVPRARLRRLLRDAGWWDRWRVRPADLDAVRTCTDEEPEGLVHHLALLAPATDFAADLGSLRLVLVSTGRDVLCRWADVEPGRGRLLVRSLPTSWEHPDSEGLGDAQLRLLARALAGAPGGAAVCLHAPLLNPAPRARVEARLPRLEPGDEDTPAARVRFEQRLFASGLRRGVFFRNAAPFLRALRGAPGPVAVFAGHVHRAHAWSWRPADGAARTLPLPLRDPDGVVFANAPAVGHVSPSDGPGFLLARFERGTLRAAARISLAPSPPRAPGAPDP